MIQERGCVCFMSLEIWSIVMHDWNNYCNSKSFIFIHTFSVFLKGLRQVYLVLIFTSMAQHYGDRHWEKSFKHGQSHQGPEPLHLNWL